MHISMLTDPRMILLRAIGKVQNVAKVKQEMTAKINIYIIL